MAGGREGQEVGWELELENIIFQGLYFKFNQNLTTSPC